MNAHPFHWLYFLVSVLLAVTPPAGRAQVWNESGDAGDLPATAQVPAGSGPLTAIVGTLLPGGDADMYWIQVDDPQAFEATTCAGGTFVDTQIWLFDSNGAGVAFEDDDPDCGLLSTLTGALVPSPGRYFLACSAYDWDALDTNGEEIWLDEPYDVERAPDGPGAPGPVASWGQTAFEEGPYEIQLAGVSWPVIGIAGPPAVPASAYRLHPNTPNPFNPRTTITYEIAAPSSVRLRVFGATGRLVRVLVDRRERLPGTRRVAWDGTDAEGRAVASGTYFYRLEAGAFVETRRMVLIR